MNRTRAWQHLLIAAAAAGGALVPAASAQAQPVLSFSDTQVTIGELTPGCEVAFLGIARERRGWTTYRTRLAGQTRDDDFDGVVSIEIAGGTPRASVWIGVDLEDGEAGLGAPGGPVRLVPEMLPGPVEIDIGGDVHGLQVCRDYVLLVIFRQGQGS